MQTILSSVRLSSLDGRKSGYDVNPSAMCICFCVCLTPIYGSLRVFCFVLFVFCIFYIWYPYQVNKLSCKNCNLNSKVVVLTDAFTRRAPNKNNVVLTIHSIAYIYVRHHTKEVGVALENTDVLSVTVGGWAPTAGLTLVSSVRIVVLWCTRIRSVHCINLTG